MLGSAEHLMGTGGRSAGVIGQTDRGIAPQPTMDGLPGHPVAHRHVGDRGPGEHFQDGPCAVVPPVSTPQARCLPTQIARFLLLSGVEPEGEDQESVTQVPEPPSPRYRSHRRPGTGAASKKCHIATGATVESLPETHKQSCPGTAH